MPACDDISPATGVQFDLPGEAWRKSDIGDDRGTDALLFPANPSNSRCSIGAMDSKVPAAVARSQSFA